MVNFIEDGSLTGLNEDQDIEYAVDEFDKSFRCNLNFENSESV